MTLDGSLENSVVGALYVHNGFSCRAHRAVEETKNFGVLVVRNVRGGKVSHVGLKDV